MGASGAGCTLSPVWGIIFKPWDDEPVYHKKGARLTGRSAHVTVCGRLIGVTTPMLPMKHCVKLGRPCKGCFDV